MDQLILSEGMHPDLAIPGENITIPSFLARASKASGEAVDTITSFITDILSREAKVSSADLAIFQALDGKARTGKNLQTEQTVQIPAKKVPKFRPGKGLREAIG